MTSEFETKRVKPDLNLQRTDHNAVATGVQRDRAPLTAACARPFRFTQNAAFGISRNNKTTDNDGERNNNVQT